MYGGSGVPDEGNDKQIAHTNDGTPDEEDDDGGDDQHQQQDRYTQGLLLVRSFQLTLHSKPERTMRTILLYVQYVVI